MRRHMRLHLVDSRLPAFRRIDSVSRPSAIASDLQQIEHFAHVLAGRTGIVSSIIVGLAAVLVIVFVWTGILDGVIDAKDTDTKWYITFGAVVTHTIMSTTSVLCRTLLALHVKLLLSGSLAVLHIKLTPHSPATGCDRAALRGHHECEALATRPVRSASGADCPETRWRDLSKRLRDVPRRLVRRFNDDPQMAYGLDRGRFDIEDPIPARHSVDRSIAAAAENPRFVRVCRTLARTNSGPSHLLSCSAKTRRHKDTNTHTQTHRH